jgi:hypothetical protein
MNPILRDFLFLLGSFFLFYLVMEHTPENLQPVGFAVAIMAIVVTLFDLVDKLLS